MGGACTILSSVACLPVRYFSTLSHKRYDCRGEINIEHKMCVLISSSTFVYNLSHSKKNSERKVKKFT